MAVTLHLAPEAEQQLRARAAQQGQTVEAYLVELVERSLSQAPPSPAPAAPTGPANADDWSREWRAWAASHPPLPHPVDDSRESIYAGRGE
jgi:hypothetical protein